MRSRQLNLAVGILLLTCLVNTATAQPAADDKPHLVDPNQYLEERVIIPLRLWDTQNDQYIDDYWQLRLFRFRIHEQGERQYPLAIDKEYRPFSIALVIDVSDSMKDSLPAVRQAGLRLFDRLKPVDQVAVLSFSDEVVLQTDFTNDRQELSRGLARLHNNGFTSLHDGIDTALDLLEHRPEPRAIVVLTDGADNRSLRRKDEVVERAHQAKIPTFFIYHRVQPAGFRYLTETAAYTGAKVFQAASGEDLAKAFGTIADGLRMTLLLAYRSSYLLEDVAWREVQVSHTNEYYEVNTWKTGYSPNDRVELSPLMGLQVPLHLPPPPDDRIEQPLPQHICPADFIGPLPEFCPGGLTVRLTSDQPSALEIRGWIDLAHDMGMLLHPSRYAGETSIPQNPGDGQFKDWRFHREYAALEALSVAVPEPDHLPADSDAIWNRLLASGATFRSMGTEEEQPGVFRPAKRTATLQPIPGYAAALGTESLQPALDLWWPDGYIVEGLRKSFISWLFRMSPDYRLWVRDRFEEATSDIVHREYETTLARLPEPVTGRLEEQLASYLESSIRSARRVEWNRIQEGEVLPSAHLFVQRRAISTAEWFNDGDRLLLTRFLDSMPISLESRETDWLLPAQRTWSDLRSFLAPTSHRSLTIGLPFNDKESGEIYLQRLMMPWCDADQRPDCIQFPPPRPEGLALVAELVARPDLESELGSGAYRCSGRCTSTETDYSDKPGSMPPRRMVAWQAVRRERDRLKSIRQDLGAFDGAWLFREEKFLDAALEDMEGLGISVLVQLQHIAGDGTGLVLKREDDIEPWASPLKPVEMVLELDDLSSTTDLAILARENGFDPESREIASALLATRINRTTLSDLRTLVGDGDDALCRTGEDFTSIRLLFHADLIENLRPARIRLLNGNNVLIMNLVAGPLERLHAALLEACEPTEPGNAP